MGANQQALLSYGAVGGGGGGDSYIANVAMLCHFDSGSGNPRTFPSSIGSDVGLLSGIVPDISATQSKWGGNSLFIAASGNAICRVNDAAVIVGTGDFAEEFYVRLGSVSPSYGLLDTRTAGTQATSYIIYTTGTSGQIAFYVNGANVITSAGSTLVANTWHLISVARISGTTRMFVDGVQVGSNYTDSNNYSSTQIHVIGSSYNGSSPAVSSYFDDWRITIGSGRGYSTNFTPPAAAFPDS